MILCKERMKIFQTVMLISDFIAKIGAEAKTSNVAEQHSLNETTTVSNISDNHQPE